MRVRESRTRTPEFFFIPTDSEETTMRRMLAWVRKKTDKARYRPQKGKAARDLSLRKHVLIAQRMHESWKRQH